MRRYTVQVVQETVVEISANNEQEAIAEAYKIYQDHDATGVDAQVLYVED